MKWEKMVRKSTNENSDKALKKLTTQENNTRQRAGDLCEMAQGAEACGTINPGDKEGRA